MNEEKFVELIEKLTECTIRVNDLGGKFEKLETKMTRLEGIREEDIRQGERIEQILERLARGNERFEGIDKRIAALELAEGKKAIKIVSLIGAGILTIVLSFLAAKVGLK